MSVKSRLEKLEQKTKTTNNDIILFIDDKAIYNGVEYTSEEFYKLYPKFKNEIFIELE